MTVERTLSIIKPDATNRNLTGKINAKFEEAGLRIAAQKRVHLTMAQAGVFYAEHADQPILVIGTHFATPTAGHIVRDGDAYRLDV